MKTTSAYGTADLGLFAYTAAGVSGFCVSESMHLEIADPNTGANLPAGEIGEIVVTTFNRDYPLIRFGTGDLGALAASPDEGNPGRQQITGLFGRSGRRHQSARDVPAPQSVAGRPHPFPANCPPASHHHAPRKMPMWSICEWS